MEFKKKCKVSTEIPTASMPDIVFMLLLFFMVTTVFRQFNGIPVDLPVAKKIRKLDAKKNVVNIWATPDEISIDDNIVLMQDVSQVMYAKIIENDRITTSLKVDKMTNMGLINKLHEELRDAGALRINYCARSGE